MARNYTDYVFTDDMAVLEITLKRKVIDVYGEKEKNLVNKKVIEIEDLTNMFYELLAFCMEVWPKYSNKDLGDLFTFMENALSEQISNYQNYGGKISDKSLISVIQ